MGQICSICINQAYFLTVVVCYAGVKNVFTVILYIDIASLVLY